MDFNAETISVTVSVIAAIIAIWQANQAKKMSEKARLQTLFQGFDSANQATINHPDLIKTVHGINLDTEECRNIAYLSILFDSFQHYSNESDLKKILDGQSTFLDEITSVPENKKRWEIMKKIYYGDFDSDFVKVIDSKFGL